MGAKILDVLSEDERLAVEILVKAGWQFQSEVTVEKGTPEGERWPLFTSGGVFAMAVLKTDAGSSPGGQKKKGGKKK
jgi:hypothetical protein